MKFYFNLFLVVLISPFSSIWAQTAPYPDVAPDGQNEINELQPSTGDYNVGPTIQLQPVTGDYNADPLIELQPTPGDQIPGLLTDSQTNEMPAPNSAGEIPHHGSDPDGPVVMNVSAEQIGDGVNVSYSLTNLQPANETAFVAAWYSINGGQDWKPCSELSGPDHGPGVSAGPLKTFTWNAKADSPGTNIPQAIIRVIATRGEIPRGFMGPGNIIPSPAGAPMGLSAFEVYEIHHQHYLALTGGSGVRPVSDFPSYVYIVDEGGWQMKSVLRGGGPDGTVGNADDDYYPGPPNSNWSETIGPEVAPLFANQSSIAQWFSGLSLESIGVFSNN
ncbi:MAG: hypothetical protein ACJZ72_06985 [Opitutales bacterium]